MMNGHGEIQAMGVSGQGRAGRQGGGRPALTGFRSVAARFPRRFLLGGDEAGFEKSRVACAGQPESLSWQGRERR